MHSHTSQKQNETTKFMNWQLALNSNTSAANHVPQLSNIVKWNLFEKNNNKNSSRPERFAAHKSLQIQLTTLDRQIAHKTV